MKQLKKRIFTLILSVSMLLLSGMTAFASGEGNIGGGGGMGSGTATDVWHGQDGVRVTVVTTDGSVASTPFDLESEFFISLAKTAPAVCMGTEKNVEDCEQNCGQYYRCSNIAEADDRSRQWGTLEALLSMHKNRSCSCNKEDAEVCPAAKYLKGTWDISAFFHSEDRKEAV